MNSFHKNNSEKSIVLAPFNSTVSHFSSFGSEVRGNMHYKHDIIKLSHLVREPDRQYEYNNNCELDNGVYNKFIMEEQKNDSLVEIPPSEKSELQEIENMI